VRTIANGGLGHVAVDFAAFLVTVMARSSTPRYARSVSVGFVPRADNDAQGDDDETPCHHIGCPPEFVSSEPETRAMSGSWAASNGVAGHSQRVLVDSAAGAGHARSTL